MSTGETTEGDAPPSTSVAPSSADTAVMGSDSEGVAPVGGVIIGSGGMDAAGVIATDAIVGYVGDAATARAVAYSGPVRSDTTLVMRDRHGNETGTLILRPVPPASPVHVLVVEDDTDSAQYYTDVLTSVGLTVTVAGSVEEAQNRVRDRAFALAIIDIRLPDGNGYELCRGLMARTPTDTFSALLMSGDPSLQDSANISRVGAKGFIVNPIEPAALAQRALAAIDRQCDAGAPAALDTAQSLAAVRLCFLGRGHIEVGAKRVSIPQGRSMEILATLAASCPAPMSSERLARFAWYERPGVSSNAVYTAVSRIRQYLADHGVPELIENEGDGYFLRIDPSNIDLVAYAERAAMALRPVSATAAELEAAQSMWQPISIESSGNPLLSHWVQRLREQWSQLSEAIAIAMLNEGRFDDAAIVCRDLLATDPWRESVWATLMVTLYRAGRPNDSLSAFADARSRLRNELGLDPGPVLRTLEMMVLTHDPALTGADPPGVVRHLSAVTTGRPMAGRVTPGHRGSLQPGNGRPGS